MTTIRMTSASWLLLAAAGLIIMSSAFVFLYGGVGLGCALGWQTRPILGTNLLTLLLIGLWFVHLAALGALQWYALGLWHNTAGPDAAAERFFSATICLVAAIGLIATIYIGFPVLVLPPCA